eukprot:140873_1
MTEHKEEEPLADYDDGDLDIPAMSTEKMAKEVKKGSYAGIQAAGFRDFLLKPEILRAVGDCGFEHPSEVQQECIPQAVLGQDIICQAKSGMGKTAVFVLAILQQIVPEEGVVDTLVLCHTRELAYQICQEFDRFIKYIDGVRTAVMFGGISEAQHIKMLQDEPPHIIVGTPGRILSLVKNKHLKLDKLKRFILDECDRMLESLDMRRDIQSIFKETPHEKQVMMFSATISSEMRVVCRKFAQNPMEIFVDDESKLTLHGLQQFYCKLAEKEKTRKLTDLLDMLDFNQVVIFVSGQRRVEQLNKLLNECGFPSLCVYGRMKQEERIKAYRKFKDYKARILVSTDLFGRGVDIERVNIVINYDMPTDADTYLHRVGRAGRFGTKGLAITFVASADDSTLLESVQKRFEVEIKDLPDTIDTSSYMTG